MPEAAGAIVPQPICASGDLAEKGRAIVFEVLHYGQPARAFALRYEGRVVAYLNRCIHVPIEMDWQPGEFLDEERLFIVCSMHGASYLPSDGRCVGGPCGRGRLTVVEVVESNGQVSWFPSRDIRPVEGAHPASTPAEPL